MVMITPTKAETLFLWRRRERLNQDQAAKLLEVSVDQYRLWEMDRSPNLPGKTLGPLEPHEIYVLCRRRAGLTQRELAARIGCSRMWVIRMEKGAVSSRKLRDFWEA